MATTTQDPLQQDNDETIRELEQLHGLDSIQRKPPVSADDLQRHFDSPAADKVYDRPGNEPLVEKPRAAKSAPSREELADDEASGEGSSFYRGSAAQQSANHEDQVGSGFVKDAVKSGGNPIKLFVSRHKRATGGGFISMVVAGLIFGSTLFSGPLQLIHIAQLMQRAHFSHQNDAGDDRTGKLFRFLRSGGDYGETRLGYLGSKMKTNMLAQLDDIGLKPNYGRLTVYQGFTIDTENPKSPYFGMSEDEIRTALSNKGISKGIAFDQGKVNVTVSGYLKEQASMKLLVDELGYSKISTVARVRVLSRYGFSTWHPMKILDKKINAKLSDLYDSWDKARQTRLKTGAEASSIDGTRAQDQEDNVDGKGKTTITDVPGEKTQLASPKVSDTLKAIGASKTVKITGGVATAVGIVCAAKSVNDNIGQIRYAQVILPLARIGMDAVTVGSQMMSGKDVDPTEVSFIAKNFNSVDANGNVTSNWSQAMPINAETGKTGGVDIDPGVKDVINKGSPSWLSWTSGSSVGTLCSKVGAVITGAVSITIGLFSGGVASTVGGLVTSAVVVPRLIDRLSNLLAGDAVNVAAKGAQWGNYVDYGSRLAANSMAMVFGGVALDNSQVAVLNAQQAAESQAEFQSKSLAGRLFDPYDERSAISKVIDNSSPSLSQNINKIGSIFTHFGSLFSAVPSLFSRPAQAASTPYDYGFPEIGFSSQDLNNPAVSDPYANADAAATIIDSTGGADSSYVKKAQACFGVDIKKGNQGWDVVPSSEQPNPYETIAKKYPQDCAKPTDPDINQDNWLKIRFFIFDTGVMEGYACVQDDEQSCSNDGFSNQAATSTPTTITDSGGSLPTGDAKTLATQLKPYIASHKINCTPLDGVHNVGCSDITNTASGTSIRDQGCQVDALQPALLGMLLRLVQMGHSFTLTALCSDHSNDGGLNGHSGGRAADFNIIDGVFMGPDPTEPWSQPKIQAASKLDQDIASFMPSSTGFGQAQCHPAFGFLNGFNTFNDTCHHQHVQAEN